MMRNSRLFELSAAGLCLASLCACAHQPPVPSCPPPETKVLNLPAPGHFRSEMDKCLKEMTTSGRDCTPLLTLPMTF
ncbi:MAG TPA: hypothetical protein VGL45_09905 [Bradyrhizobium sp.]